METQWTEWAVAPPPAASARAAPGLTGRDSHLSLRIKLDPLAKPHGSAMAQAGNTKVLATAYGPVHHPNPRHHDAAKLETSIAHAPFALKCPITDQTAQTKRNRTMSHALQTAISSSIRLDQYPKSKIIIHVLVIEGDGDVLAPAISCASLALAQAGIELYDIVAACSCARIQGKLKLDCDADMQTRSDGTTLVALMPSLNQTTLVQSDGAATFEESTEAMCLVIEGCLRFAEQMREALRASYDGNGWALIVQVSNHLSNYDRGYYYSN